MKNKNKSKQAQETTSAGGSKARKAPRMSVPLVTPIPNEDKEPKAKAFAAAASGENVPVVTPIPTTAEETENNKRV
jgi:hypothetical protein